MGDKYCIVIDPVKAGKIWDKTMVKPAGEALARALGKALSSKAKIADKCGKDEKGLRISLNLAELAFDDKKSVLSASVKGVVARLPEDSYLAGLTGGGKVPGANPKKIADDVVMLMESVGEDFGGKVKKALEKL